MLFELRECAFFEISLTFLMKICETPEISIFPMEYWCFWRSSLQKFWNFYDKIINFWEMLILPMVLNGFWGSRNDKIYDSCDLFSGNPGILCFPKGNEGFCTPRGALGTPTCQNSNIPIGFLGFCLCARWGKSRRPRGGRGAPEGGGLSGTAAVKSDPTTRTTHRHVQHSPRNVVGVFHPPLNKLFAP